MDLERKKIKSGWEPKYKHRHSHGNRRRQRSLKKKARRYVDMLLREE